MSIKHPYRLISFACHDAAMNMAIDEAILEAHLNGHVPPTLRIYQFSPPAVSFGYAQKVDKSILKQIREHNLAIVRRPTGGRAVLHIGDITYSFVCSSKGTNISDYALVGESIAEAYKQICQALIVALAFLGVSVELGQKNGRYQDKHDCFLATTAADLQYGDKKIAGSAQLRRKHAVLQHGSIILNQPQSLLTQLLSIHQQNTDQRDNTNSSHHANLDDILGADTLVANLENAFKHGFEKVFENQFLSAEFTEQEQELATNLVGKYKMPI